MKAVHYRAWSAPALGRHRAACGKSIKHRENASDEVGQVTCKSCRATHLFAGARDDLELARCSRGFVIVLGFCCAEHM